jgi:hypothetical protein
VSVETLNEKTTVSSEIFPPVATNSATTPLDKLRRVDARIPYYLRTIDNCDHH